MEKDGFLDVGGGKVDMQERERKKIRRKCRRKVKMKIMKKKKRQVKKSGDAGKQGVEEDHKSEGGGKGKNES